MSFISFTIVIASGVDTSSTDNTISPDFIPTFAALVPAPVSSITFVELPLSSCLNVTPIFPSIFCAFLTSAVYIFPSLYELEN